MNELNEYSNEYRKSLDYICYNLNQNNIGSILVKEKSSHFALGFLKRFFYSDIDIFIDIEKDVGTISKDLGKSVKTYSGENIDALTFPFSLEAEKDWVNNLRDSLRETRSEFVVIAFRSSLSYKLFMGRGTKETLNPSKVRAILKECNYSIINEKGGLHLKYIIYSFVASIFEKIGKSALYFRLIDRAVNAYFTDNYLQRSLSYIQIIIAKKGERDERN